MNSRTALTICCSDTGGVWPQEVSISKGWVPEDWEMCSDLKDPPQMMTSSVKDLQHCSVCDQTVA